MRTDWTVREDVRAKLRSSVKRLLILNGYPPGQQLEAIKLVIEQMENMAAQRTISAKVPNMPIQFDDVLVIGIASSALFYLAEVSHEIFEAKGRDAYQAHQREHRDDILEPGPAFSFIKKLLALNDLSDEKDLVDVVLLSRNSPETGYRVKEVDYTTD